MHAQTTQTQAWKQARTHIHYVPWSAPNFNTDSHQSALVVVSAFQVWQSTSNWLCPSVCWYVGNALVRRSTRSTLLAYLALFIGGLYVGNMLCFKFQDWTIDGFLVMNIFSINDNSRKSVRWSAVPVPCLSRLWMKLRGEQGSGPKGVDDLCFHTYGEFSPPSPSAPAPPALWPKF